MKVGIFSDTHLGFDEKGERNSESFDNLSQAVDICVAEKADFIVLPGDVFDAPVPSHTSLYKSFSCFAKAKSYNSDVSLVFEKGEEKKNLNVSGIPILAIHGNHEFLGKDTKTALDVLNVAGLVGYFHAGRISVSKGDEKVFVYGLGSVPEKRALDALHKWNPVPEKDHSNLLLLHQGFKEFMAIEDEMIATLSLDNLPKGFDIIVNGHLHWRNVQELGGTTFLLPGSTIATSIKKIEADNPKGVYFFDTVSKELSFKEFPVQRKAFYNKLVFDSADAAAVISECKSVIQSCLQNTSGLKPLIRLNIKGSLKKGLSSSDVDLSGVLSDFSESAILSVSKNFSDVSFKQKISELRNLQSSRLSVASVGIDILEKTLAETDFGNEIQVKDLFDLLSEDEFDKAMAMLVKN